MTTISVAAPKAVCPRRPPAFAFSFRSLFSHGPRSILASILALRISPDDEAKALSSAARKIGAVL